MADDLESNSSGRSSLSSFSTVSEATVNPNGQFVFKDVNFEVRYDYVGIYSNT